MPGSPKTHQEALLKYKRAIQRYPRPKGSKISTKSLSRDIARQLEHFAGRPENIRARQIRLAQAELRKEKTGTSKPIDTSRARGAQKAFGNISVGHPSVRSRFIYHGIPVEEATTEAKVTPQTERSNYGKLGQQARSIPEWKKYLSSKGFSVWPDRPTEIDTNKTRVASRMRPMYGPAPRSGMAAGFTGRLPGIASMLIEPLALAAIAGVRKDVSIGDVWNYLNNKYNSQQQEGPMA